MFGNLDSEKGFGLVQAIVVLGIVTVSLTGLFISSFYARNKANENYHYRVALLKATALLEELKWHNRISVGEPNIDIPSGKEGTFVLDERDNFPLIANYSITKSLSYSTTIINYVYKKVIITATWKEGPLNIYGSPTNKKQTLVLREDYYFRSDI